MNTEQILASQHMFLLGYQFTIPMKTLTNILTNCFGPLLKSYLSQYLKHKITYTNMMKVISPLLTEEKTNPLYSQTVGEKRHFKKNRLQTV